jgi:hypothetical protein
METLIQQAFKHVDVIGPLVAEGRYDLLGPNGEIVLPDVWETVIEPDWTITMHMWPMPEEPEPGKADDIVVVPEVPLPDAGAKSGQSLQKTREINMHLTHSLEKKKSTKRPVSFFGARPKPKPVKAAAKKP